MQRDGKRVQLVHCVCLVHNAQWNTEATVLEIAYLSKEEEDDGEEEEDDGEEKEENDDGSKVGRKGADLLGESDDVGCKVDLEPQDIASATHP